MSDKRIPDDLQQWIDARKRHHLSHAHIQMARELGMKPKSLGKLDNHRQERWKLPLPEFIEELYLKRFGKERPDVVMSIEDRARHQQQKKAARREARRLRREAAPPTLPEGAAEPKEFEPQSWGERSKRMEYLSVPEARNISGLRIVLSPGGPGPWSEAAKCICYLKKLSYIPVAQEVGGPNPELEEWTSQTSAPAVIWNDERPRNLWNDQLFLFERLAPDPPLVPHRIDERATMFGYANEICGENGFAWNRRLLQFHYVLNSPKSSPRAVERFGGGARKYLYSPERAAAAPGRCAEILGFLADRLEAQRARGSKYFIGEQQTALDIYWATFATLIDPLPHAINPMQDGLRRLYTNTDPVIQAAVRPILMEHREMMYRDHLETPLDF